MTIRTAPPPRAESPFRFLNNETGCVVAEDWLTVEQAAEIAELDPATLRRAVRLGQLEHKRIGKRLILVTREALDAWLKTKSYHKPGPKRKT